MKSRAAIVAIVSLLALFMSKPARLHGQPALPSPQPATSPSTVPDARVDIMTMLARMNADTPTLDQLVKTMNAANGSTKIDAMAKILTTLVEERRNVYEPIMANITSMMRMTGGRGGTAAAPPQK